MTDALYLRWGSQRNRADDLARALDMPLAALDVPLRGALLAPLRYLWLAWRSLSLLARRRPRLVVAQLTHPFAALVALGYARLAGARLVNDVHNAPFDARPWTLWPLSALAHAAFAGADLNLVHNAGVLTRTRGLRGRFAVLHDPLPEPAVSDRAPAEPPYLLVVSSFSADEPATAVIEAARLAPDVRLRMTGDPARLPHSLRTTLPPNLSLTGFLPEDAFDAMLADATAAVTVSTRSDVLMRATHEALAAGVPVVVSDTAVARAYLRCGALFAENHADALATAFRAAVENAQSLRCGARTQRDALRRRWPAHAAAVIAGAGVALSAGANRISSSQ